MAVLVLLVVVSGSLEDRVRADRRFGRPAHLTKRLVYEVGISRSRVSVKAPSPAPLIFKSRIFARVLGVVFKVVRGEPRVRAHLVPHHGVEVDDFDIDWRFAQLGRRLGILLAEEARGI